MYQNMYEGAEFPQTHEIAFILTMCYFVKDNFMCIDALNETSKHFKDHHVQIQEAITLIQQRF